MTFTTLIESAGRESIQVSPRRAKILAPMRRVPSFGSSAQTHRPRQCLSQLVVALQRVQLQMPLRFASGVVHSPQLRSAPFRFSLQRPIRYRQTLLAHARL